MNFKIFQDSFPDLNFDSLTMSRIPRIRILFPRKNFRGMQKSLDFVLSKIFMSEWQLFTLNQLYWWNNKWAKKIQSSFLKEIENLWIGDVYNYPNLFTEIIDDITIYNRIIPITYETLLKLSIIDAWWRSEKYWKKHGLPFIEMDNFLFSEKLNFLVHVNFILLDPIDWDGIDVSSYSKEYLLSLSSYFIDLGFKVLIDRIDTFNV